MDFLRCNSEFTITEGIQVDLWHSKSTCHYYSSDTTEVKPWDRESVVSKLTSPCEPKAGRISDTRAIDGFEKNSKTYFDDSRVITHIVSPKKKGHIIVWKDHLHPLFHWGPLYLLQHRLACKERREPAGETTKTGNQWMLLNYKMINQGLFESNGSESIQSKPVLSQMAKLRPQEIKGFLPIYYNKEI